jgi:DNA polymerase-3 subunit epsilon
VNFFAIDVETANPALSSICQVGIASFRDGRLCGSWESLINPEDYFDPINVSIHGIDEGDVQSSPTWCEVYPGVCAVLQDGIAVSHTAFDRVSILRACERNDLPCREFRWLDSAKVVRRAWPIFSKRGYGLANVAVHFCIQYRAHDALEDARGAGEILLRAIAETGLSNQLSYRCRPIFSRASFELISRFNSEIAWRADSSSFKSSTEPTTILRCFLLSPGRDSLHLYSQTSGPRRRGARMRLPFCIASPL